MIKSILKTETIVRTGLVRFSYAHVFEPYEKSGKYSVTLLIPKEDTETIENIKQAMDNANSIGKYEKFGGKEVKEPHKILHDGDEEKPDDENYKGHYYITASCIDKPGVVNRKRQPITDTTEFYSGCYGSATINLYPYNSNNNIGIACGLNNLMKIKDGDAFTSRVKAEDDFADFDFEDDDDFKDEDDDFDFGLDDDSSIPF